MIYLRKLILVVMTIWFLTGCGGNGNSGGSTTQGGTTTSSQGTAQLGNLANASVKIYQVEDNGSLVLKWSETTSDGDTLDEIGKFNLHDDELEADKFYVYKVIGGDDWDSNDDGIKDANPTQNKGVIRAIAKGSDIQNIGNDFKVTAISELLYEKVAKTLKYDFNSSTFGDTLNQQAKIITNDVDGDTEVNYLDILRYNPINDKTKLQDLYRIKMNQIIDIIHEGKTVLLNIDYFFGSYDTNGYAEGVTLSSDGTKAYVADEGDGLVVVDIRDPANPTKFGSYDTDGYANGVTLSSDGTKAYVADGGDGLVIIDISDPANPTKFGSYDTDGYANSVTLSSDGTKAYIADEDDGLVIIDISDPANPTKLGSYDTDGYARGVTLSSDGTKAYVADYYDGLVVVDISDPANPTKLGSYDTDGRAMGVTLSSDGTKAYVADYNDGLVVVDISDPANPTKFGSYDTDGYANGVTLSSDGTKAYVTCGYKGLAIIDLSLFE